MTTSVTTHEQLVLGVAQFSMRDTERHHDAVAHNVARAVEHVRAAHAQGAQVVLLPELFSAQYFPREMHDKHFALAHPVQEDPALRALAPLARELSVVIPVSFFERDGAAYYNSLALLDADGALLGVYRKTHIPDGTGYEEKYYFRPGDTGFRVWATRHGKLGVGICWDQWFPECARAMTLQGADVLLYPTAIGSEPVTTRDTKKPWRRAMVGHAVSNTIHVAAANRVGDEAGQIFYGTSFIADPWGEIMGELHAEEGVLVRTLDLATARADRDWMGLLKDRRPDTYAELVAPQASSRSKPE